MWTWVGTPSLSLLIHLQLSLELMSLANKSNNTSPTFKATDSNKSKSPTMIVSFTRSTNNLKTNLFSISFPQFWRKSLIVWHSNIRIISWAFFSHHRKMPLLSELRNILNLLDITILTSLLKCQYQLVLWICIWLIWASRLRPKTINYKATILSNPIQRLRVY